MAPLGRGRVGSYVWYHFININGKGKCRYCEKQISMSGGNSTGNLRRHLKKKHPSVSFDREDGFGDEKIDDGSTQNFGNIEIKCEGAGSNELELESLDKTCISTITSKSNIQEDSPVIYMVSSSQRRPIKRKISISPIEKSTINKLSRVPNDCRENFDDEFELFCKSLSCQLRKMPVERAIICQEKLQSVMTQERLQQIRS